MANEKDAVMDFLNGTSEPKELFSEEAPAEAAIEEEEIEEKPLPFHKDPKVQRYVEKQIEKALKDVKPSAEREFKQDTQDINLPNSFIKLIGNDTAEKVEVLKDMSKYFGNLKGEARQEFLEEVKQQEAQAKAKDEAALEELTTGFEAIEEEYGVDLESDPRVKTAFLAFLKKIAPKDENGEVAAFPDLVSSYETFQEMNKRPTATRAKQLAARGVTRSTDASAIPTGPKPSAGDPWRQFDRYLDSLNK